MKIIKIARVKEGFSLIELIIVLMLLSIVLTSIFNFFHFSQKQYIESEAQSIMQDDINNVIQMIGRDIRNAVKPNKYTRSVVIPEESDGLVAGQRLDIYTFDGSKYTRTVYRLKPGDKTVLEKGFVEVAKPDKNSVCPSYGAITNWVSVLEGIQYKNESSSISLFTDITLKSDEPSDRRVININIKSKGSGEKVAKYFELSVDFTSRTKGM